MGCSREVCDERFQGSVWWEVLGKCVMRGSREVCDGRF
jgi:hypothetical protein